MFERIKTTAPFIVIALMPVLYAGMLIAANYDPIGKLSALPALIVDEDRPAEMSDQTLHLGPDLVDELMGGDADNDADEEEKTSFDWALADNAASADRALDTGDVMVVLYISPDLSEAVASGASGMEDDPLAAFAGQITIETNDAQNYVMGTIASTVGSVLQDTLSSQLSEEAFAKVLGVANDVHDALGEAADGSGELTDGMVEAEDGSGQLADGLGSLSGGTTDLETGAAGLSSGLDQLAAGTQNLPAQSRQLNDGASALASGTGQLAGQLPQLADGAKKLSGGLNEAASGTKALNAGAGELAKNLNGVADAADGAQDKVMGITAKVRDMLTNASQAAENLPVEGSTQPGDLVNDAHQMSQSVQAVLNNPDLRAALEEAGELAEFEEMAALANRVNTGVQQTSEALAAADQATATLREELSGVSWDDLVADTYAVEKVMGEMVGGAHQLAEGADELSAGLGSLNASMPQLVSGGKQVAEGATAASQGANQLTTGAQRLNAGTAQLSQATPMLADGIGQAQQGANALADGAGKLDTGAGEAVEASNTLKLGLGELLAGSEELHSGLSDGADQAPSFTDAESDHLSAWMGQPVNVEVESKNEMANNGTGLAPYFMSLALWIGGIALFMLMAPIPDKIQNLKLSAPVMTLRVMWPTLVMGTVQGAAAVGLLLAFSAFDAVHPWMLLGMAIASSVVFVLVNHALIALLGPAGRFVSLLLVLSQLASAGGTYPWQVLPDWMQTLRQYLPMTYTVEAFRALIGGGSLDSLPMAWTVLGVYAVLAIIGLFLASLLVPRVPEVADWAGLAPGMPGGGRAPANGGSGQKAGGVSGDSSEVHSDVVTSG